MCTHFIGIGAIQVGLRRVNVFLAVAILSHFVIGLGLGSRRAGFGDLFGTIAALGFFGVGAGLLESGLELLLVKGDQDLAWLDGVPFAHEDFINATADFGAYADVARFDGAGALEGGVAPEPRGVERRARDDGDEHNEDDKPPAGHGTNLPGVEVAASGGIADG